MKNWKAASWPHRAAEQTASLGIALLSIGVITDTLWLSATGGILALIGLPILFVMMRRERSRGQKHEIAPISAERLDAGMAARIGKTVVDPAIVWEFDAGRCPYGRHLKVADGTLYIRGDNLYALDARDGTERWRFEEDQKYLASLDVVDGVVYARTAYTDMYALDAKDGSERWRFAAERRSWSGWKLVEGVVFTACDGGYVYAIDALNGIERWRFPEESPLTHCHLLDVLDGVAYCQLRRHLYALDAASGRERWRFETGYEDIESLTVSAGVVYVGCYSTRPHEYEIKEVGNEADIVAIDADCGAERWRFGFETWADDASAHVVVDGVVYAGCNGSTFALDAVTGSLVWRLFAHDFETVNDYGWWMTSPVVVADVVYVGCGNGNVYAIDQVTGSELWRFATDGSLPSSLTVENGIISFETNGGNHYALDAKTGTKLWKFTTQRRPDATSIVAGELEFVSSFDGRVYAIAAPSRTS